MISDYKTVRMGDLIVERKERCPDPQNGEYDRFIGLEHMDTGRLEVTRFGSTDDVTTSCKICHEGDILFGRRNPYLRRAGVVYFDSTCSGDIIVFRAKEDVTDPRYLSIVMATRDFWTHAMKAQGGTMSKRVHYDDFADYEFKLPSLDDQRKIADLIWSYESLMKELDNQIENLDNLVKSRFNEMFGSMERVSLTELASITMGQSPDSSSYNNECRGVPFFQGKAEFGEVFVSENMYCDSPKKMAKPMDILMSVRAPVGSVNIASKDCCIGRGLAAITPYSGRTNVWFLFYALRLIEEEIESMGVGSTFKAICKSDMINIHLPMPSIELQNQFADFVKQVDKSKFSLKKYKNRLMEMQIALINGPLVTQ